VCTTVRVQKYYLSEYSIPPSTSPPSLLIYVCMYVREGVSVFSHIYAARVSPLRTPLIGGGKFPICVSLLWRTIFSVFAAQNTKISWVRSCQSFKGFICCAPKEGN